MIRFESVTFTYSGADSPTLAGVDFTIDEGTMALVVGPTGAGKSTLLGAISGLVPRFTGGTLSGTVTVGGRRTSDHSLKEMADLVGTVGQDPRAGFVSETVEDELAYTMEQLGLPAQVMRARVEEVLDLLGLVSIRNRRLDSISGGEAQRVAIGSVLAAHPRVLVLDEPTSALDPAAAEEVLSAITRLVHDLALTVVIAEHRLERVVQYADQVIHVAGPGQVSVGEPATLMEESLVAPPVVELGRLAGWSPLPLSVRDARRRASHLTLAPPPDRPAAVAGEPTLVATDVSVVFGDVVALREVDFTVTRGEVTALMGRNGSGKSTLLWALQGSGPRTGGRVSVDGADPAGLGPAEARRLVGLVPQTPSDLLYRETVAQECDQADRESGAEAGSCRRLLDSILPGVEATAHPSDLSEGQRLALVLAIQLTATPQVILLDEPTRGLDYAAKHRVAQHLRSLAEEGRGVVVATHDVEFVAQACDRVVILADGEVVAAGPTAEVVTASPALAPQISRVMAPAQWLTVAEIAAALAQEAM